MTTPRNSVSGTFPTEPAKGPLATHPAQKANLRRTSSLVGPTQSFFMRESKALGVRLSSALYSGNALTCRSGCFRLYMNLVHLAQADPSEAFFIVHTVGWARRHQVQPGALQGDLTLSLGMMSILGHCSDSRHVCPLEVPCVVGEVGLSGKRAKFSAALPLLLGSLHGL